MRPGIWTWEEEPQQPVSISFRPTSTGSAHEEIPEWAIANTPLRTVVAPPVEPPEPYVARVQISPSVRTDIMSVDLVVREGMTLLHLRVRVASMLGVPPHRLNMTNMDNNELPLQQQVPTSFRDNDRWAAKSVAYDIMDVYLGPMGSDSAFVLRLIRIWTHEQIIEKIASIIGVSSNNVPVTDMDGNQWHYPESRATSMAVMVHARRHTQTVPPSIHHRGGARTISTTLPCHEAQQLSEGEDGADHDETHHHDNHAECAEGEVLDEDACLVDDELDEDGNPKCL